MHNLPWLRDKVYPLQILPTRIMLQGTGKPYCIENVMGARWGAKGLAKRGLEAHGMQAGWLCGLMFGLPLYRHRLFETNWLWLAPGHPKHRQRIRSGRSLAGRARDIVFSEKRSALPKSQGHYGLKLRDGYEHTAWQNSGFREQDGAYKAGVGVGHAKGWRLAAAAMGVLWMDRDGLSQAIPPVYTQFIGDNFRRHCNGLGK